MPAFGPSPARSSRLRGSTSSAKRADGQSALALTRTLAPELVLLDVALPDMDGFAVCEALLEGGSGPAVILTSSRDVSSYRRRLKRSRARGFIPKSELSGPALAELAGG